MFVRGILTRYIVLAEGDFNQRIEVGSVLYNGHDEPLSLLINVIIWVCCGVVNSYKCLLLLFNEKTVGRISLLPVTAVCQLYWFHLRGQWCVLDLVSFCATVDHYWLLIFIVVFLALHRIDRLSVGGQRGPAVEIWQCERLVHQTSSWLLASFNHASANSWWFNLIHP